MHAEDMTKYFDVMKCVCFLYVVVLGFYDCMGGYV